MNTVSLYIKLHSYTGSVIYLFGNRKKQQHIGRVLMYFVFVVKHHYQLCFNNLYY